MKRPVPGARRVVYGSQPMTSKQLAQHLKNRCLKELHNATTVAEARSKTNSHEEAVRHLIDGPYPNANGGHEITFAKQNLHSVPYSSYEPGRYLSEWTVTLIVTPELDVVFKEESGRLSPRDMHEVEAVLQCALRGSDKRLY